MTRTQLIAVGILAVLAVLTAVGPLVLLFWFR